MDIKEPNLNAMLKGHMRYMSQRQSVLAQNIANIDTPNYKASDLKKIDFADLANAEAKGPSRLAMRATSPKHLTGTLGEGGNNSFAIAKDRDTFEISPNKNNVVLEDQMAKVSDTGAQFQLSSTMLKKFSQLYRTAASNK